jgi:hypothetical protein
VQLSRFSLLSSTMRYRVPPALLSQAGSPGPSPSGAKWAFAAEEEEEEGGGEEGEVGRRRRRLHILYPCERGATGEEEELEEVELEASLKCCAWLNDEVLACGLTGGRLALLRCRRNEKPCVALSCDVRSAQSSQRRHTHDAVLSCMALSPATTAMRSLWLLFADDSVCSLNMEELIVAATGPSAPAPRATVYQLKHQREITCFAAIPPPPMLLPSSEPPPNVSDVLICGGLDPSLGYFAVDRESQGLDLGHLAWSVAGRLLGGVVGVLGFVGHRFGLSGGTSSLSASHSPPPPPAVRCSPIIVDERRRVISIIASPSGHLTAISDSLGRVMLVDPCTRTAVKIWKGVREGQCAFLQVAEAWSGGRVIAASCTSTKEASAEAMNFLVRLGHDSSSMEFVTVVGLYLAILAPQRGHVNIWRMRHGPCVRTLPVRKGSGLYVRSPSEGRDLVGAWLASPGSSEGMNFMETVPLEVHAGHLSSLSGCLFPVSPSPVAESDADAASGSALVHKFSSLLQLPSEELKAAEPELLECLEAIAGLAMHRPFAAAMRLLDECDCGNLSSDSLYRRAAELSGEWTSPTRSDEKFHSRLWVRYAAFKLYDMLQATLPEAVTSAAVDIPGRLCPGGGWMLRERVKEGVAWAQAYDTRTALDEVLPSTRLPSLQEFTTTTLRSCCAAEIDDWNRGGDSYSSVKAGIVGSLRLNQSWTDDCDRLIGWMLEPLLGDLFSLHVVESMLAVLEPASPSRASYSNPLASAGPAALRALARWFLSLPPAKAASVTGGRDARACSLLRLFKGAVSEWDSVHQLTPVWEECISSPNLECAFMLTTVVAEALQEEGSHRENKSYGLHNPEDVLGGVERWMRLQRQLRLILVLDHRVRHKTGRLKGGADQRYFFSSFFCPKIYSYFYSGLGLQCKLWSRGSCRS